MKKNENVKENYMKLENYRIVPQKGNEMNDEMKERNVRENRDG